MKKYDMAFIGSGSGLIVMEAALSAGLKCAVIEKGKFGGTCLTKGCIPSKMLVYPADLIREAQIGKRIGLSFDTPHINWANIKGRVWEQIDFCKKIEKNLGETNNLDVYKGLAEFIGSHEIKVTKSDESIIQFHADIVVIAAGARSLIPPIGGLEEAGYITSESFFGEKFPQQPYKSLAIIGAGAVGTEFAHIFSAFGTKVTLIQLSERIIPTEEEEVSEFVAENLSNNGVEILTNTKVTRAKKGATGKIVVAEEISSGKIREIEAEEIFICTGVRSNGDKLNLPNAKIETDNLGYIKVNEYLETSTEGIYAIGDINGKYQFRHKANYEAMILSKNLFGTEEKEPVAYDSTPWAIFTWPQVGHVGMTERMAREMGIGYGIARNYYSRIAGGISMGITYESVDNGFAKIILGRDLKILGAHIVGPYASMLIQPFVYLMNSGTICTKHLSSCNFSHDCPNMNTIAPMTNSMIIHPSMNELAAWAFENVEWVE